MKKILLFTTITLALSIGFMDNITYAVTASPTINNSAETGQALEIGPPIISLSADPGQTLTTQLTIRDISNGKLIVTGVVNDFEAAGEDGTPKIFTDENSKSAYSIKEWVGALPSITLKSKELKTLPITIKVPANASPGGYYGIIRFSSKAPELEDTGVALSASIGSMVMIRVKGDAKESMSVDSFYASINKNSKGDSLFETTPITFVARLKNDGNVYEQPTGQITIKDMFNKEIAAVNVNLESLNVLPGSTRKFAQNLDKAVIGDKKLFGRYTADLKITYGSKKEVVTKSITFWVVPYRLIGLGAIALIACFITLRFILKNYNKMIIKKAEKAKSKTKSKK